MTEKNDKSIAEEAEDFVATNRKDREDWAQLKPYVTLEGRVEIIEDFNAMLILYTGKSSDSFFRDVVSFSRKKLQRIHECDEPSPYLKIVIELKKTHAILDDIFNK